MQINNYKITELARGKKKEQLSSVFSHIVRNMKQLLARACPGFSYASYSLAKKAKNYLSIGQPRLGQKLPVSLKINLSNIQIQTLITYEQ